MHHEDAAVLLTFRVAAGDGHRVQFTEAEGIKNLRRGDVAEWIRRGVLFLRLVLLHRLGEAFACEGDEAGAIRIDGEIRAALLDLHHTGEVITHLRGGLAAGFQYGEQVLHHFLAAGDHKGAVHDRVGIHPGGIGFTGLQQHGDLRALDLLGAFFVVRMLLAAAFEDFGLQLAHGGLAIADVHQRAPADPVFLVKAVRVLRADEADHAAFGQLHELLQRHAVALAEILVPHILAVLFHRGHPALRLLILHKFAGTARVPVRHHRGHVLEGDDADGVLRSEVDPLIELVRCGCRQREE